MGQEAFKRDLEAYLSETTNDRKKANTKAGKTLCKLAQECIKLCAKKEEGKKTGIDAVTLVLTAI